jgi:SAM-dependent methyltransferase
LLLRKFMKPTATNYLDHFGTFWTGKQSPLHRQTTPAEYARYAEELRFLFSPASPSKVLDIGCGSGDMHAALGFDRLQYRGVDFSASMLEAFRRQYPQADLVCASGHSYRDDRTYDMVFSNGVLQNFDAEMLDQHVANAAAMLAPGGILVADSLPWKLHQVAYYTQEITRPGKPSFRCRLTAWVKCHRPDTRIGHWFTLDELEALARKHAFSATHYGSLLYPYRLHAVLTREWRAVLGRPGR